MPNTGYSFTSGETVTPGKLNQAVNDATLQPADITAVVPQLADATSVNAADELIVHQGGTAKRATAQELINVSPVTANWNNRGFLMYPDTNGSLIHRMKDRLFVGQGADFTGNFNGTQSGFVPTGTEGAAWGPRDSVLFAANDKGLISVSGFASNANRARPSYLPCIGVAGFAISEASGFSNHFSVWGLYSDIQQNAGVPAGQYAHGLEIAAKNNASNRSSNPYLRHGGVIGIWLAGGGDPSYGGAGANPCNSAMDIIMNGHTWNRGIIFHKDSLTGSDGTTGAASAILMARGHQVEWWSDGSSSATFYIRSDMTGGAGVQRMLVNNSGIDFGTATDPHLRILRVSSAVNGIQIYPNVTSQGPIVSAIGSDTNIDLQLQGKGTGRLMFGTHTATSDTAISGFITIKDSAGNQRKLAVIP